MKLTDIIGALKNDTALIEMLVDGKNSIYHIHSPNAGSYPVVVVAVIADVPALAADNVELSSKQTIRIHVITKDGRHEEIARRIMYIMFSFPTVVRVSAFEHWEDKLFIRTIDFVNLTNEGD